MSLLKNVFGKSFDGETGLVEYLICQGTWFGGETGLWGNWLGGKSAGNLFLVTLAKIFIITLVVKQVSFNAKVSDITIL